MTIGEVYRQSINHPSVEQAAVKLLLAHLEGFDSSQFFLHLDDIFTKKDIYNTMFSRLLEGEPIQYIIGSAHFYNRDFEVDETVLIPRQETEVMVKEVQDWINKRSAKSLIDLGTGSGCLAVTIKALFPDVKVWASDISKSSLEIAMRNSDKHQTSINFVQGDWLRPFIEKRIMVDIIMSNPPYIASPQTVANNVINYEPHIALFSPQGIGNHIKIINDAKHCLNQGGLLILEIDEDQSHLLAPIVKQVFKDAKIDFIRDLQGKQRFLKVEIK